MAKKRRGSRRRSRRGSRRTIVTRSQGRGRPKGGSAPRRLPKPRQAARGSPVNPYGRSSVGTFYGKTNHKLRGHDEL